MALILARAWASLRPSSRSSTLVPLMLSGITLALRASRESNPRLASICCSSSWRGPMWRAVNSLAGVRLTVMARSSSFSVGFDQTVVRILIQQLSHCIGIGGFKAEEPAFAHRVFVDQFRAAIELVVDFEDFTVQRHVHTTGGLDRLHGGGFGALGISLQLWQLHENHITQRVLRKSGDTHGDAAIGFGAQPFVIFSETQLAHRNSSGPESSGGRDWNNEELLSNIAANVIKSL